MNTISIYEDRGGEWRWRCVAPNGRIVADSSEGYTRETDARRAAAAFIDAGQQLETPGLETR